MSSLPGEVGHATIPRNPERMSAPLLRKSLRNLPFRVTFTPSLSRLLVIAAFDADAHFRSQAVSLQLAPPTPTAPAPTEAERAAKLQDLYPFRSMLICNEKPQFALILGLILSVDLHRQV
jgi:hypothetical protein